MSYVTKLKQENKMKRVSFALILVILSFGLSYGIALDAIISGPGAYDGGTKININTAFDVEIVCTYSSGDEDKMDWSTPFLFYGTGDVTDITGGAGNFTWDAGFASHWNMGYFLNDESWDGVLDNMETGGYADGDMYNFSGICNPTSPGYTPLPGSGSATIFTIEFGGIVGTSTTSGTFCVDSGDMLGGTYDWLMAPPVNFGPICWDVEEQPDPPPTFDNCPTTTHIMQWNDSYYYDLDATDGAPVTPGGITFTKMSGPGSVDPVTGEVTWQPTCANVGAHAIVVCAEDAANPCPTTFECTINIQVNNTAPVIGGDCGNTITIGTGGTKTAQFTATDVNGVTDTKTWSATVLPAFTDPASTFSIDANGLLTFSPGSLEAAPQTFTFTVKVTDCNGDFDDCEVYFDCISEMPFDIVIEKLHGALQGHHSYVKVTKEEGSEEIWGFDFLIGYDNGALTFISAAQGAGIADWEYFTFRYSWNGNCGNGCPTGLLRVVAFADENDGPNHPAPGFGDIANGATLFTLDFLVTSNYNYQGQFVPIYFYWYDCGDNTMAIHYKAAADPLEVKTAIAKEVYWYNGTDPALYYGYLLINPPAGFETFPTPYGEHAVELECLCGPQPPNPDKCPVQFIRFFGGGIDIIPVALLDDRGDVNLNGVPNEIADAVVFTNYFIYGPSAFTINFEGQKAATEVNGDGIALTVADLVYLIRVVVGDALPLPAFKPVPTALNVVSSDVVSVDAAIGGAHFVFDGDVNVTLAEGAVGMELLTNYRNGQTHALLYSMDKGVTANGSILNTNGSLVSVDAATYEGAVYKTVIVPKAFTVKSYPNPFNPVANIEMSLPVASDWTITIYNVVGQRVADFNGHSDAGVVKAQWDASNEASGIYFYKVDAGKYTVTKKMVLLK